MASAAEAAAARIGAALSDAQYFESSMVREVDIRRQLDSTSVKDKLDAMKRVVALISLGKDASSFFPDVVKNVVTSSLEIKKLVYLYLVHYAEDQPDLALLSINSFQKDLSDPSQLIRCLSLRVLSSIRVKVILQIVILAIAKCSKDSSPYVRKAAAHAIGKVCQLDSSSFEALEEPLRALLRDCSVVVLGSAVAVLEKVAPNKLNLLHPHYRRLCRSLVDMDVWEQISCINVLLRYVRVHFPDPHPQSGAEVKHTLQSQKKREVNGATLNGGLGSTISQYPGYYVLDSAAVCDDKEPDYEVHPDIELLLKSVEPLFLTSNACVMLLCVSLFYHVGSRRDFISKALPVVIKMVLLDRADVVAALKTILLIAPDYSESLLDHLSLFFLSAMDSPQVRQLKLKILMVIVQNSSIGKKPAHLRTLLLELRYYLLSTDRSAASCAARAFGMLATSYPPSVSPIVRLLASTATKSTQGSVTSEVVSVLTKLLQRHPNAQPLALPQLVRLLLCPTGPQAPAARASIIYVLSEFHHSIPNVAPEALRRLAKSFPEEHPSAKTMTVNLAARLYSHALTQSVDESTPNVATLRMLLDYVTTMGMLDANYDLRDYSRLMKFSLLSYSEEQIRLSEKVQYAFTSRKPVSLAEHPQDQVRLGRMEETVLGSMHHIVGKKLAGWRELPPWAESLIAEEERRETEGAFQVTSRDLVSLSSADYHANEALEQSVWEKDPTISGYSGEQKAQSLIRNSQTYDPESFYDDVQSTSSSGSYETDTEDQSSSNEGDHTESLDVPHRDKKKEEGSFLDLDNLLNQKDSTLEHESSLDLSRPSKKSASEEVQGLSRDWVADLARLHVSQSLAMGSIKSEWQRALESWNGGGLQVDYAFSRSQVQSDRHLTIMKMKVQNCAKESISRTITSQSAAVKLSRPLEVKLEAGESREFSVNAALEGQVKPVSFQLEDGTSFKAKPNLGEVIKPYYGLMCSEYERLEKKLHGMLVNSCTLSVAQDSFSKIPEAVTKSTFLAEVFGHFSTESDLIGSWAGYLPRESEIPVLLKVKKSKEGKTENEITIWIGCEDVLFGSNLIQCVREKLKNLGS